MGWDGMGWGEPGALTQLCPCASEGSERLLRAVAGGQGRGRQGAAATHGPGGLVSARPQDARPQWEGGDGGLGGKGRLFQTCSRFAARCWAFPVGFKQALAQPS